MTNSHFLELESAYLDAVRSQTRLQNALGHFKQVNTNNSGASERLKTAKELIRELIQPGTSGSFTIQS